MGTNECLQPASKSSWDSQDFGDVNMELKMVHFRKSTRSQWVNGFLQTTFQVIAQTSLWLTHGGTDGRTNTQAGTGNDNTP